MSINSSAADSTLLPEEGKWLRHLIGALRQVRLEADDNEIADALWLAVQIRRAVGEPIAPTVPMETGQDEKQIKANGEGEESEGSHNGTTTSPFEKSAETPTENTITSRSPEENKTRRVDSGHRPLLPSEANKGEGGEVLPYRAPSATALPGKRGIVRSLQLLRHRVASPNRWDLDIEATVEGIADGGIWAPVLRPTQERWLGVTVVVDAGPSMAIWRETAAELRTLLEQQGVFRDVHTWELHADPGTSPFLLPFRRAGRSGERGQDASQRHSPREILEARSGPNRQRLILVLSDAVGPAWHDGSFSRLLREWGTHHLVAMIQVLPPRLWMRTGLRDGEEAFFQSSTPGAPNPRWQVFHPDLLPDEAQAPDLFSLPVMMLHGEHIRAFAHLIRARRGAWAGGVTLPDPGPASPPVLSSAPSKTAINSAQPPSSPDPEIAPETRLQRFLQSASVSARSLAVSLASSPTNYLTLPVMRLIQQVMTPEGLQADLAEVYLSGLLRRAPGQETQDAAIAEYEFHPEIRGSLLKTVNPKQAFHVMRQVSAFVNKRAGSTDDFLAFLLSPSAAGAASLAENSGFAEVAASVLRRLGGRYAELAELMEPVIQIQPESEHLSPVIPYGEHPSLSVGELIFPMAWSPDGAYLAIPTIGGQLLLWCYKTKRKFYQHSVSSEGLNQVVWSPDGRNLVTSCHDHLVRIHKGTNGKVLRTLKGHHSDVQAVAWGRTQPQNSPTITRIVTGTRGGTIRLFDPLTGSLLAFENPRLGAIEALSWMPESSERLFGYFAAAFEESRVRVYRVSEQATLEIVAEFEAPYQRPSSLAFVDKSPCLAIGTFDGLLYLWDVPLESRSENTRTIKAHSAVIQGISVSYDGRVLATKGRDGEVRLWSVASLARVSRISEPFAAAWFAGLSFHPIKPLLATLGDRDTSVRLWETDLDILAGTAPPTPRPITRRFALLIGVDRSDLKVQEDIRFCRNDIESLKLALQALGIENVVTLLNEEASQERVREELERLRSEAGPDDFVYLHFSGNGFDTVLQGERQFPAALLGTHDFSPTSESDVLSPPLSVWEVCEVFRQEGAPRLLFTLDSGNEKFARRAVESGTGVAVIASGGGANKELGHGGLVWQLLREIAQLIPMPVTYKGLSIEQIALRAIDVLGYQSVFYSACDYLGLRPLSISGEKPSSSLQVSALLPLAREYTETRLNSRRSAVRTKSMNEIVWRMNELVGKAILVWEWLPFLFGETAGERLVGVVLCKANPHMDCLAWLVERCQLESAFIVRHTCLALRRMVQVYGRFPEYAPHIEQALREARGLIKNDDNLESHTHLIDNALVLLTSFVSEEQENYEDAEKLLTESLVRCRKLTDRDGEAVTLEHLAMMSKARSKYRESERLLNESLIIFQELRDRVSEARVREIIATIPRSRLTRETKMPAGRVTIVNVDLLDSSGILNQLGGQSYRVNLLDPYIERLEKLLEPGIIFQFKGDGFITVFQHARDALESAIQLQRDLTKNKITFKDRDSQQTYELNARISLYTSPGEATPNWHDANGWTYVYEATNLAARIEGSGKGGQILAAQTTIEKINHTFDIPWIKWEARALRNHSGPVDLYEILWDADVNPEGRGEPGPRFRRTSDFGERIRFIRRPLEEKAITDALLDASPRLVTIHASGGMGKTILARYCAAETNILTWFTDGIHFIPLENSQCSVESMKETICTGIGWESARFTLESLRDQLLTQKRLLVLDTYESVQCPGVQNYLSTFVVSGAKLRLLVTSRHPVGLGQAKEQRVSLEEGMTDGEANELLLDRIRVQKGQNWDPDPTETIALREIREATENNPLALELIAAWANSTYSLPGIAARLKQRLVSSLTSTTKGVAPFDGKTRHLSLQGSLEWSWSMILMMENGPFLREGMLRLSLYPATFTQEAVEKIFGYSEDEADDLLTGLFNASLLRESEIEEVKRFYFSRATREFATDKLNEGSDASTIRSAFVHYWLQWLKVNENIGDLETLKLLRQEWRNIIASSEIAENNGDWETVTLLSQLYDFFRIEGLYIEAETLLRRALRGCEHLNNSQLRGVILNNMGLVYQSQNKFFEAEEVYKQSLVITKDFKDRVGEGQTLNALGVVYQAQNRFSEAEEAYNQSLVIMREFQNTVGEGQTLESLALLMASQNNLAQALEFARQSVIVLQSTQAIVELEEAKSLLMWLQEKSNESNSIDGNISIKAR